MNGLGLNVNRKTALQSIQDRRFVANACIEPSHCTFCASARCTRAGLYRGASCDVARFRGRAAGRIDAKPAMLIGAALTMTLFGALTFVDLPWLNTLTSSALIHLAH